jgi:ABC-type ATPase involved in cell division
VLEVRAIMQLLTLAVLAAATAQVGESLSAPGTALAEGRLAVVAIGRCEDSRLGQAARDLRAELRMQHGAIVQSEDDTARPAGGIPRSSLEEINKEIQAGREQFFGLDYGTAETTLRKVLPDIDRLPPGALRWEASTRARIEVAQVSFFNEKRSQAGEMFSDILRLDENLKLDRHLYPPLLHQALEEARRSVRKARRFKLRVLSKEEQQPLYVNGSELGKTPFERSLVEGNYEIIVGDPTAHSFVRHVELHSDREIEVEVSREARFKAAAGPCFDTDATPKERLAAAALVASTLHVEQVAMVWLESAAGEEYVLAALHDVARGRELYQARQRTDHVRIPRMKNLAAFVLTGDKSVLEDAKSDIPTREEPEHRRRSSLWLRGGGVALGAAAVGLGIAALIENGQAAEARSDRQKAIAGGPGPLSQERIDQASDALRRYDVATRLTAGLAVGSIVAALGSGTLFLVSLRPDPAAGGAQVHVAVSGDLP